MPQVDDFPSGDTAQRLERLDHYITRQGEIISAIVKDVFALQARVQTLELYAETRRITEAREDERDKALYGRLDRIEKDVDSIKGIGAKALWIVGSAIILAAVGFVLKGGLV